ncbi:hypothetical protein BH23ACT9_BH23ACT9_03320 [soil metagenome]
MASLQEDTRIVREEFDAISKPTQVFIAVLVALGIILGVLLGGFIGYGIAVDEVDGRDCIEHQDTLYCADGPEGQ